MLVSFLLAGTCQSVTAGDAVAYFADRNNDRVFAIDPRSMSLRSTIPTAGDSPYPVDSVGNDKVYVSTRGSYSLDIVDNSTMTRVGQIPLDHAPRSVTYNATRNLVAVSGVGSAMTTIIDVASDQVLGVVGDPAIVTPTDYGGTLATGHPFWVDKKRFLMLDRARRSVSMWKVTGSGRITFLSAIDTPTSVHHFVRIPNAKGHDKWKFYGMAEGAPASGMAPAVIEVVVDDDTENLVLTRLTSLVAPGTDASQMGSHHVDISPDGKHLHAGSKEGHHFVLDRQTMQIVSVLQTGKGDGHTTFIPERNLAITTNHIDTYMSVIDATTLAKIADIPVTVPQATPGQNTQSHTSSYDPENPRFFYSAASDHGDFFEIDLDNMVVSRVLPLSPGGYPIQGTFVWDLDTPE